MSGIRTLTLDRPDKGNALSAALVERLLDAFHQAVADPATLAIVIRGLGRHFCTGFDLAELDTSSDGDLLQRFVRIETLLDAIWRAPVPVTAVAQGRLWGAGADLFAACEHRVLASDAHVRFPGAGFGLVLGTRRLTCRVGPHRARLLTCDGQTLDATGGPPGLSPPRSTMCHRTLPGTAFCVTSRRLLPVPQPTSRNKRPR